MNFFYKAYSVIYLIVGWVYVQILCFCLPTV